MGYGREGNSVEDNERIKWHADELYQKQARLRDQPESENRGVDGDTNK